jgi:hypothetical protein
MKNFPKINLVQDALHGMAYYIFLKSLRSLEEFRKNSHVKIPPKSPSTNFPSLGKFKIHFLFEKNSSSEFSPLGPAGPRAGGAPPNHHLPHRKTPPATLPSPSLHARLTDGPHLSSLTSGPPELDCATTTSRRSPRRPALPRMPPELLPPHHHFLG